MDLTLCQLPQHVLGVSLLYKKSSTAFSIITDVANLSPMLITTSKKFSSWRCKQKSLDITLC